MRGERERLVRAAPRRRRRGLPARLERREANTVTSGSRRAGTDEVRPAREGATSTAAAGSESIWTGCCLRARGAPRAPKLRERTSSASGERDRRRGASR